MIMDIAAGIVLAVLCLALGAGLLVWVLQDFTLEGAIIKLSRAIVATIAILVVSMLF